MHTPGPFFPDLNGDNTIHTADGFIVATVNPFASSFDNGEHVANQHLLAAAPELLAALERLCRVASVELGITRPDVIEQAKAAIAKARGETI